MYLVTYPFGVPWRIGILHDGDVFHRGDSPVQKRLEGHEQQLPEREVCLSLRLPSSPAQSAAYVRRCRASPFARSEPTDIRRDWSEAHYSDEKGKYMYEVTLESNVVPQYAWFNGRSWAQLPGEAVTRNARGEVVMVRPEGSRDDPTAKIYPFKVHRAVLPVLAVRQWLLPIATEEIYYDGDVDAAVREAGRYFYGLDEVEYEWAETVRHMGIFHGVVPKVQALVCGDCHGESGRMDWRALGYEGDPRRSARATR